MHAWSLLYPIDYYVACLPLQIVEYSCSVFKLPQLKLFCFVLLVQGIEMHTHYISLLYINVEDQRKLEQR